MSGQPLRFEGAVIEGAQPAQRPGWLRVLGQTVSPGAAPAYHAARLRWNAVVEAAQQARGAGAPSLVRLLSEVPPGCLADGDAIVRAVRTHLKLPTGKAAATASLEPEAPVRDDVEAFVIDADDDRVALRGQRGVRAMAPLPAGAVIGCLRARVLTQTEWEAAKWPPAGGALGGVAAGLAHELAVEAFGHEFVAHNEERVNEARAAGAQPPPRLYASAHGVGNLVSLVNDGRALPSQARHGEPLPFARPNNCALLEFEVRCWPVLVLVTLQPILQGEELLMDYGDVFWDIFGNLHSRLGSAPCARGGSGAAAERSGAQTASALLLRSGGGDSAAAAAAARGVALRVAAPGESGSGSCRGGDGGVDTGASLPPAAGGSLAQWRPFGTTSLLKLRPVDGGADAVCALVAHASAASAAPPPWALRGTLTIVATSKGNDPAIALAPLLRNGCEPVVVLLAVAPGADAKARDRLSKLVQLLRKTGKAARCIDAADGRRDAYLLPPGALADAQLAAAGAPAALPVEPPYLIALVLRPGAAAPAAPRVAPLPVAAVTPAAPTAAAAVPVAAPPLPLAADVTGFDDDDAVMQEPPAQAQPPAARDNAALCAAAEKELLSTETRGVMALQFLRRRIPWPVEEQQLHAALAAAPRRFELVPRCTLNVLGFAVYLLQPDAGSRGGVCRVTPPPVLSAEQAAYAKRLVAWLRRKARWCCEDEVLDEVPTPPGTLPAMFVRELVTVLPDDLATSHGCANFRALAALLPDGGVPGGAPLTGDGVPTLTRAYRATRCRDERASSNPAAAPLPCVAPAADAAGKGTSPRRQACPQGTAPLPPYPPPPPLRGSAAAADAFCNTASASALCAEAEEALLGAGTRCVMTLSALVRRLRVPGDAPEPALRAALAAAPRRFQLAPRCANGMLSCDVFLLQPDAIGGVSRIAPPPTRTAQQVTCGEQLVTWLRQQHRWCCEAEVSAALCERTGGFVATPFLRFVAQLYPDDVATAAGYAAFAALGPGGALPGDPPAGRQLSELESAFRSRGAAAAAPPRPQQRAPEPTASAAAPCAAAAPPVPAARVQVATATAPTQLLVPPAQAQPAPPQPAPARASTALLPLVSAELRAAARVALAAPRVNGTMLLSELQHAARKYLPRGAPLPREDALRAALAAAPLQFQVVPQHLHGTPRVAVHLLRTDAATGQQVRLSRPPAQSAEEATYCALLLAWLRQQGRWCHRKELRTALPPPATHNELNWLFNCVGALEDYVATTAGHVMLAALRDGVPPELPPEQPLLLVAVSHVLAGNGGVLHLPKLRQKTYALFQLEQMESTNEVLLEALAAAPRHFELVPRMLDGVRLTAVYLLVRDFATGACVRLARPTTLLGLDAAYGGALLAWLRQQARWCSCGEVLDALPPPPSVSTANCIGFLRRIITALPDDVASDFKRQSIAAMRDGQPPGPPPSLPNTDSKQAPEHDVAPRNGGVEPEGAPPPAPAQAVSAEALQTAARLVLQESQVHHMRLQHLPSHVQRYLLPGAPLPEVEGLRAALASAPQQFELVPRFSTGKRVTTVYLLVPSAAGAPPVRAAVPPALSAEESAYSASLLAWLRQQARWCSREEVLEAVPPPESVPLKSRLKYLRRTTAILMDHVASSASLAHFAALRDGEPPGEPPPLQSKPAACPPSATLHDMFRAARLRCLEWGVSAAALSSLCDKGRDERRRNAVALAALPPGAPRPSESRAARSVELQQPLPAVLNDSPQRVRDLLSAAAGATVRVDRVANTVRVLFQRRSGALAALALDRMRLSRGDAPLLVTSCEKASRKRSRSRSPDEQRPAARAKH